MHRLKHRYDRGFRGGNKVLRSGIKGESSVVDYIGSIEREVVSQEYWNVEDTYSKDVQICTTLSMHISCAHEGFNRLFEQEVYYFFVEISEFLNLKLLCRTSFFSINKLCMCKLL